MVLHLKTESNRYTFVDFLSYLFHLQIPGKMQGYNWLNETIDLPPVEIMPPVLKGLLDANGNQYYTVTGEHCILEIDGLLSVCLKVKRKLNCLYGNYIYICNTAYCCIDYILPTQENTLEYMKQSYTVIQYTLQIYFSSFKV